MFYVLKVIRNVRLICREFGLVRAIEVSTSRDYASSEAKAQDLSELQYSAKGSVTFFVFVGDDSPRIVASLRLAKSVTEGRRQSRLLQEM